MRRFCQHSLWGFNFTMESASSAIPSLLFLLPCKPLFFTLPVNFEIFFALAIVKVILSYTFYRGVHCNRARITVEKFVSIRVQSRGISFRSIHPHVNNDGVLGILKKNTVSLIRKTALSCLVGK